jgi:outer membrane protein TolC
MKKNSHHTIYKIGTMRKIICKYLLLIVFLYLFAVGNCQQISDSLYKYFEIAAKNNPSVLQKYCEYQAALEKVPQAGSLPDPELSMGVFLQPMELVNGNQVAEIRLMQMFPWFGVLSNAKDEMSLMAKAKYETFRDTKLQVIYDVQRTWYDLYEVQKYLCISEMNIEILNTLERISLVMYKSAPAGSINSSSSGSTMSNINYRNGSSGMPMSGNSVTTQNQPSPAMQNTFTGSSAGGSGLVDLYRIQMDIGELDNNISLLKDQKQTIIARFNSYLNRPLNTPVFIPDTLKPDILEKSLFAFSDSVLNNNPMLVMLKYEKQSLDARKKMVSRMGFPMVGLGVNYSIINKSDLSTSSMNGKDMIMPMLSVTLPIYRKKYKAMQSEAELMSTANDQYYQAAGNSLQTEYYEAFQLYEDAGRRIKLYENQCQLAKKSLDIMIKSFSASGTGLTDILQIRQQTLDYELKQIKALVDYNTAIAWLKRLTDIIPIQ